MKIKRFFLLSEYDMVLCELVMPQLDGLMLIRAGLKIDPHLIGIV